MQDTQVFDILEKELPNIKRKQIDTVLHLLSEGNTVPFIARYRKEQTGSLDEVEIREIEERHAYIEGLVKRKEEVTRLISEQGKLTKDLEKKINAAKKMQRVEDLYRPFKQKRRTKATIAKENGLEPLADWLLTFPSNGSVEDEAAKYVNEEVKTSEEALSGAHEIIAEVISDEPSYREWLRNMTKQTGLYTTKVKDKSLDEKSVYEMYYDFSEPMKKMVSHRVLAANRGEKEGVLKVAIEIDSNRVYQYFERHLIKSETSIATPYIRSAYEDSYKRFIGPAIEREIRNELTEKADEQAITIFGENLKNLLLQPPLKGKVVLGFDPAYRTGCKLAIVDPTGKLLAVHVIYPHKPANAKKREEAKPEFIKLLEEYKVEMVAIGNGTASRESEAFVSECLKEMKRPVFYVIVNEAGASVYSASDTAREEFPNLQVEERSAVSIGRRLQDPLAELVKIDPKAVGVGQYQHDVSQKRLGEKLDFVIEMVVNQVGVNVNTASAQLLQHVAGLNKTTAKNIVIYREENGEFTSRTSLKKVPRLGPKAYEQSIGFLRIPNAKNILDTTGIHPESYGLVKQLLKELAIDISEIGTEETNAKLEKVSVEQMSETLSVGKETLEDVISALRQPGRDMRDDLAAPILRKDILKMEDLKPGMQLEGTVRNVVDFGAFVDIGVKQDGLVHISKLSQSYIKHPTDVVAVGDVVTVWIVDVDVQKQRITLTMIDPTQK
ncbi:MULTISPECIES: Tex family protein [Enterococcaceae]|uniref:Tex family protein n=1 Tax=Enterococcaceae TaxID=81852 RepID=UPI000E4AFD79|nr:MULTISPECIES: Tex family protein [Enterococcaceae]MCI0130509.1 RNA-binding transcriptional accessory protein [Vagococcus sp. CY53-2]RGI32231.1 RNA-binding transcriptional accessory protein [Melissococcus sp. OM08-11BH]UNM89940.1 RNA-binding transcriptional accessory protein [Vagococcus sp. CY52-2]